MGCAGQRLVPPQNASPSRHETLSHQLYLFLQIVDMMGSHDLSTKRSTAPHQQSCQESVASYLIYADVRAFQYDDVKGPIYTMSWHPSHKNRLATGGRDRAMYVAASCYYLEDPPTIYIYIYI